MSYERKVRPIYDALDARNPKLALKLYASALQKAPLGIRRTRSW
jgi:hypothetical protein